MTDSPQESQQPSEKSFAGEPDLQVDQVLADAVREIEAHAAEAGWDQPARLYALVPTSDLLAREPALAAAMGLDDAGAAGSLTPVEQDGVSPDTPLETVLERIMWPADVFGCAAVVERLVLPPSVDQTLPTDPVEAERYAAEHPAREEVRIVAGATRAGSTYCALRMRSHDDALSVVEAPDLVPGLLQLVQSTLES
jgi:hypothetical protein